MDASMGALCDLVRLFSGENEALRVMLKKLADDGKADGLSPIGPWLKEIDAVLRPHVANEELLAALVDCLSFDRPATCDKMVNEARDLMLLYGHPVGNDFRTARLVIDRTDAISPSQKRKLLDADFDWAALQRLRKSSP